MSLNLLPIAMDEFLQADDEVLITVAEHHANIVPWHLLAERKGIKVIAAPVRKMAVLICPSLNSALQSVPELSPFRMFRTCWAQSSTFRRLPRWRIMQGLSVLLMAVRCGAYAGRCA